MLYSNQLAGRLAPCPEVCSSWFLFLKPFLSISRFSLNHRTEWYISYFAPSTSNYYNNTVARAAQWISCMGDIALAYDQQITIKILHPARTRVDKGSNSGSYFALLTTLLKVDSCSWKSQSTCIAHHANDPAHHALLISHHTHVLQVLQQRAMWLLIPPVCITRLHFLNFSNLVHARGNITTGLNFLFLASLGMKHLDSAMLTMLS